MDNQLVGVRGNIWNLSSSMWPILASPCFTVFIMWKYKILYHWWNAQYTLITLPKSSGNTSQDSQTIHHDSPTLHWSLSLTSMNHRHL
ncbi:hypothetical protein CROQUDRAFT_178011 [Cronartium quercuum f. sp. fusiforme G11]|uniref:Uncharacterized protein n=1 Tax=Cronartium quercuum f. sp. fusiforme G11 TaxID=708437 RepID=A0A9P6TG32_9BASI|nr:hypothetical protein CROQUDRAFT_178011 [Cronartium quercuum f. sp. fusiforme G11]